MVVAPFGPASAGGCLLPCNVSESEAGLPGVNFSCGSADTWRSAGEKGRAYLEGGVEGGVLRLLVWGLVWLEDEDEVLGLL